MTAKVAIGFLQHSKEEATQKEVASSYSKNYL